MTLLFSRRLRRSWEFTPGLLLWRLHPPVNGKIIGEVRDPEAKRTSFFALDGETGACLWRDREFHDAWWVAIERVSGDKLVLHGFTSPDFPMPRGATVVDIPSGTCVWSDAEWTGDEQALARAGVPQAAADSTRGTFFPTVHNPQEPETAQNVVLARWPLDMVVGPIETAGHGDHTVVAAHVKSGKGEDVPIVQLLKVQSTQTGKVVYEDTLIAAAKGIAPDAFFIHEGMLFYIRERSTLCAVRL